MSVAVILNDTSQPERLLPWAKRLAIARETNLIAIIPKRSNEVGECKPISASVSDSSVGRSLVAVATELALNGDEATASNNDHLDTVELTVMELTGSKLDQTLVEQIDPLGISLLVIPASVITRSNNHADDWLRGLFGHAQCETMCLRDDTHQRFDRLEALVPITSSEDDPAALKTAHALVEKGNGVLTVCYVGPYVDEVSAGVGRRIIDRKIATAVGLMSSHVKREVVLADSIVEAIHQIDATRFDLILFGGQKPRDLRRILEGQLFSGEQPDVVPAVGVVRSSMPFSGRMMRWFRGSVERYVPQLDREARISLVERIQSSSEWNFDFIALLSLATLIAGLGLIRNSASVVIGAMLVAPLMTPIVGSGLGLAQGNIRLIRDALGTVVRGFVTAFWIGVMLGVFACTDMTTEMLSRGSPTFLDLIVALVSGVAAAYAMGRPNLLSALPGVAIAAALVPPLATSGMAAAQLQWPLAWGALLLFLTNIVAIILGTTTTFWMVGIRPEKKDKPTPNWPLALLLVLVAMTVGLTALMNV